MRGVGSFLGVCWMLLAGCASGGFAGGVYDGPDVRYRLVPSSGYTPLGIDEHDVAFEVSGGGTVGVSSRCEGYEDVPARALVGHLLFGTTDRVRRLEETTTVDGRGALHVVIDVALDGVPVTLDIFVLPKDGCLFDFVYVSPRPGDPAERAAFAQFVQSFRLLEVK
ncbi:MAG: hypothetical protein OXR73_11385 [Myxococcales bacterium]|nr:hypothetical protein [Myxococcales bacterium]